MEPLRYIASMFACGFAMGMVFDVYNTVLGASRWLRWLRPFLDLTYWLAAAGVVFYLTFVTDLGRFRLYTFGLLLLGYLVYRALLHHAIVGSAFAIVRFIRGIVLLAARGVNWVLIRPLGAILRLVWFVLRQLYRLLCLLEDAVVWVARFWLSLFTFPLRRPWQQTAPARARIHHRWEGFWARASNWILGQDSERV
jgi:spore cortex biosynthesis protein YabQ